MVGATGRQGGAIARLLLDSGRATRIMTRRPEAEAAMRLAQAGGEVAAADLDDPASLAAALDGVSAVYAMQTPYEAGTEAEEVQGVRLALLARQAGVDQLVYVSVASADEATGVAHYESKGRIEAAVKAEGFPSWTILRPTFFMEMFLRPFFKRALASGRISLTMRPDTRMALISVRDIARAAAAAFADPQAWAGITLDLAAETSSLTDIAAGFSRALDRPVAYEQVAPSTLPADVTPKLATQAWFDRAGWDPDLAAIRRALPFTPLRLEDWARVHRTELTGQDHD